jgi:hypothetical protein
MAQGAAATRSYLGIGAHATSLTDLRQAKVAPTSFARLHTIQTVDKHGEEVQETGGMPDPEGVSLGDYDYRIRATFEGTAEGPVVPLARSLMGVQPVTTTVGTTGKQHVLTGVADTLPLAGGRLSTEVRKGTSGVSVQANGVCDELEFQITQAGYARWATSIIGSSPARNGSPTSPTYPDMATILSKRVTTFNFNSATTKVVRGLSWKLKRGVDDKDYDVTSRQRRDAGYAGPVETTFDAELQFFDDTELREFWGGAGVSTPGDDSTYYPVNIKTARNDVIAGGTAKQTVELDLPKVFITEKSEGIQGRDAMRQRVRGRAIYSPSGSVYAQKLTVSNSVASYAL